MNSFFTELKRCNVVRVAVDYAIVCWLAIQIGEAVLSGFGAPEWVFKTLILFLAIGFPFFYAMLESEDVESHPKLPVPYRCK